MKDKYDIVIVGSGLGGLFCGAMLTKAGKRVCVLERHTKIGGNLQVYSLYGHKFSAGMHYAGCLDKDQILYKIFNYLGIMKHLHISKLDEECFEKVIIGDKEYSYAMGMDNFMNTLTDYFPDEKKAIESYCKKLDEIWEGSNLLNLRELSFDEMPTFDEYKENAYDYINSVTKNEDLRALLAATNGLYAGVKTKTPLYIHANINNFFIKSAYRIAEDGANLAELLKEMIENNNGTVLKQKDVTKFEFENENISAAVTANGEKYYGDHFISNIHPNSTFDLVEPGKLRKVYVNRIKELQNTISTFSLNIVLKKKSFKNINSNVYYSASNKDVWDGYEYSQESWPRGYMLYTTEDPKNPGYAESMVILSMMKFDDVRQWSDTTVLKRGDEYLKFKEKRTKKLLNVVHGKFPKLENACEKVFSATPLTYRDYTGSHEGSMYGIVKDCNDPLKTIISPRTKIPNLLLTGQNIGLHGSLGVVMSGFQTCSALLNINEIIKEIREY